MNYLSRAVYKLQSVLLSGYSSHSLYSAALGDRTPMVHCLPSRTPRAISRAPKLVQFSLMDPKVHNLWR